MEALVAELVDASLASLASANVDPLGSNDWASTKQQPSNENAWKTRQSRSQNLRGGAIRASTPRRQDGAGTKTTPQETDVQVSLTLEYCMTQTT